MRKRAAEELAPRGLAYHAQPPGGGRARWHVDLRADPKLADTAPDAAPGQASALQYASHAQRRRAFARADCVRQLRELRCHASGSMAQHTPALIRKLQEQYHPMGVSQRSLCRWDAQFGSGDVAALLDDRGGDQKSAGDPAAWSHFRELYLDDRQPTLRDCWRRVKIAAKAQGWAWSSETSCRRQLNQRIEPERQLYHREPRKWRQQMQPGIEQDPEAWAAGECWVGDHAQLDLWCWFGRSLIRPWATAWIDWRTRWVTAVLSPSPNSSTIMASLRAGLLDEQAMGGPRAIWIDNGRDYDCYAFHAQTKQQRLGKRRVEYDETEFKGLFGLLGIEAHFSIAHNPNGKARMERWFDTVHLQFDKTFASYCGRSPEHRPESLKAVLADPAKAPTFGEVAEQFDAYLAASNMRTDHAIDDLCDPRGMVPLSPVDALAQWSPTRRVLADPGVLDLLMQQWHKPVQAHRNGITIKPFGQTLRYGGMSEALRPYKALRGEDRPWLRVTYDPADLSRIRVYSQDFRFIGEVAMNDLGGLHDGSAISQERVKALIKRQRDYKRGLKIVRNNQELEYLRAGELLTLSQPDPATAPKPRQSSIDQSMTIVKTPLDGEAKHVQREQLRKAAGAEHDATPAAGGDGLRGFDRIFSRMHDAEARREADADPFEVFRTSAKLDTERAWDRFNKANAEPLDIFESQTADGEEGGA
ncbi:MAG: DNA-binding domain-containing protein [Phycisphaeraceae bacterium]